MGLFNDLKNIPQSGVYSLVNKQDKRILISYSTYILGAIGRIIRDIQNRSHESDKLIADSNKLELIILEETSDLKLRATYYANKYEEDGYELYKPVKFVEYTPRKCIKSTYVYVYLVSNSYYEFVVGVFKKMKDADNFIDKHYKDGVNYIKYADNKLTKEYLNGKN